MHAYTIRYDADIIRESSARIPSARAAMHDLKNLMTAIGGYLPELRAGRLSTADGVVLASLVEHAIVRCRSVRGPETAEAIVSIELDTFLGRLSPVLHGMIDRSVHLRIRAEAAVTARASVAALECVVLNLVANASKAVGHHGAITVSAGTAGRTTVLSVDDTGPGLDPDVLDAAFSNRAFLPPPRGLGLSIVRDCLASLDASLRVTSGPTGTSVRVELPTPAR